MFIVGVISVGAVVFSGKYYEYALERINIWCLDTVLIWCE